MGREERIAWLDAAKGIGIICVVMGHITIDPVLGRFIFSFHMPLFFFLSGVAYNFSRQDQFIRRHARTLLIPYFAFGLMSFLYWAVLERHFRFSDASPAGIFLNIFIAQGDGYIFNSVLWFLPCLFVVEALFHAMRRRAYGRAHGKAALAFICVLAALLGFALSGSPPFPSSFRPGLRLPWTLDSALLGILFYALGFMLGRDGASAEREGVKVFPVTKLPDKVLLGALLAAGLAVCLCLAEFFPAKTDLAALLVPAPLHFYFGSFSGILAAVAASRLFPALWLQKLGRLSLVIMCIHDPVKRVALQAVATLSGVNARDLRAGPACVLILVIVLACCVPLALCIERYLPWMLGKKAKPTKGKDPGYADSL